MRFFSTTVLATLLGLGAALPLQGVGAASVLPFPSEHVAKVFAPVVVEWFSSVRPRAGQHIVVYTRLLNNNRPVGGARLTAVVQLDKHVLMTVRGSKTDRKGVAKAAFRVPGSVGGKTLRVMVTLRYKGRSYLGRNDLRVQR